MKIVCNANDLCYDLLRRLRLEVRLKKNIELSPCLPDGSSTAIHPILKVYFGHCLARITMKYKAMMAKELAPYNIVGPQLGLMRLLMEGGPTSQITLGQDIGVDKASMVKFIDGLEKKKWVRRVQDKFDRRVKLVELTPKGLEGLKALADVHDKVVAEFLSPLSKSERDQLKNLISKLA